ncbi:MAG TPA: NAD(P)-binding protein, partial [Nannocystaceae bacterium]|nr:NAD(P)-binding protein [Nannocystaceae bacterium]
MPIFERPHELRPVVREIAEVGRSALASGRIAAAAGLGGGGSLTEGIGRIDMRAVIRVLPREIVERLLPAGLQLAPQPLVPPGRHPIFVLCSHDWFDAWFGDMDYHELMIGVPYVELADAQARNRGPFVYMPRLHLDQALPRVLGNAIYGFEKLPGRIAVDDEAGTYRVTDPDSGGELASLAWEATADWSPPAALPGFAWVRKLFEMPTVSQAQRVFDVNAFSDRDDPPLFLCSTVTYGLADPSARVQPIRARLRLGEALTPAGLPTDVFASDGLDTAFLGAFRLQAPQVVSLPGACATTRFTAAPGPVQRVLVLGGGPAACTAAYWLAQAPDRFRVTLATQGFRLGGKCAASRNPDADMRIEEHGLHAFVGFYENAFRTVREVYDTAELPIAVGRPPYDLEHGEG